MHIYTVYSHSCSQATELTVQQALVMGHAETLTVLQQTEELWCQLFITRARHILLYRWHRCYYHKKCPQMHRLTIQLRASNAVHWCSSMLSPLD